jgi:glycosyltransferase involved in cell wall biosynthesis
MNNNTEEIKKIRNGSSTDTVLDGVNLKYYENLSSKIDAKKKLELPLDKTIITYTGALIANKGIVYLFEAILEVLKKNQKPFFILAGFPVEEAEKFIIKNSLKESVRLISPLNYFELPEILNASDIGIDPKDSFSKQASGKILQYMGAGIPVICFDRPNNREYLRDGAFYADEISAEGLVKTILFALDNPLEVESRGNFNKKRAINFSWDLSAEKIDQIYKK